MRRYASSLILLATLAVALAAVLISLQSAGRLTRAPRAFEDRQGASSPLCRVEDGALKLNINEATAADIQLLSGFGEALSQAVVDYRTANGPFRSVDELANVPGVGAARLEAVKPYICCD